MEPLPAALHTQNQPAFSGGKRHSGIEITVAYGLILAVEWTPRPLQGVLWVVAAASAVLFTCISFEGWTAMGFHITNFGRSLWIAGVALLLAAGTIALSVMLGTFRVLDGPRALVAAYCAYAIWAGVQQFLLQDFFLLRFLRLIDSPKAAALAAAGLFAAAHVPNPVLTPITAIWGFVSCKLFLRYRNIYPLMMGHAILGITVAMTIPGAVDHNMRVGLGYLTYNPHKNAYKMYRLSEP